MPLDHLLAALERDAAATADRLLAEARDEAARLDARSTEEVTRRREAEVSRVTGERRGVMEGEIAAVRRRSRGAVLAARARFLERVEGALHRELPRLLTRPEYLAQLPSRVAEGIGALGPGEQIVVRCPRALLEAVRAALPTPSLADLKADDRVGNGLVLASADGVVEVEDTLEGRFEARRGALAREALGAVGGAG